MKKIIIFCACLFLLVFFNTNTLPTDQNTDDFFTHSNMFYLDYEEILIRDIVKAPDNKIYLLSDNEDYEFSDVEARYLQPLLQPEYMTSILKNNNETHDLSIRFFADRSNNIVQLEYNLEVPIQHLNTLRHSVNGLDQRWRIFYGDGRCFSEDFFHKEPSECEENKPRTSISFYIDRHTINGHIVKLSDRDKILKNNSLPMPIKSTVSNFRPKTDTDIWLENWENTKKFIKDAAKEGLIIITAPIWLPIYLYALRDKIG